MSLSVVLSEIVDSIQGLAVASGPSYVHARSAGQGLNDRAFSIDVLSRVGPRQTGTEPLIDFEAVVELALRARKNNEFADMERLANEGAAIARRLEQETAFSGDSAVIVTGTAYQFSGEDYHLASIQLQVTTRES